MGVGEMVLRALSRPPGTSDYSLETQHDAPGNECALLRREFEDFSSLVRGKRVADFGCGTGLQCIALARDEGAFAVGIDTNAATLQIARENAAAAGFGEQQIQFVERITPELRGTCDIVISQNAMEHFPEPDAIVREMSTLLKPGGKILLTFGPPWYAPYGSHMQFFCRVPWLNLWFSERTVMRVRAQYRNDGATRYESVESGLNRMSIRKFERIMAQSGLRVARAKYTCVKQFNGLARIPGLRELVINHVTVVLERPAGPASASAANVSVAK
jgi:SAM-dependent methyltransferase